MEKLQKVKEICGKHKYEEMLEKICDCYIETHEKKIKKDGNLEIDHVTPYAKGGSNDLNNLRLYCKAHNQREAIKEFGQSTMDEFINRSKITSPGESKWMPIS